MNIYVGNLANQAGDDDLRQAFEAFGQVESVNIIKDRFSGESRGFGFVEMPSKEEAQKALVRVIPFLDKLVDSNTIHFIPINCF